MPNNKVEVTITGQAQLERRLATLAVQLGDRVREALYQEAELIMTEAKRRTPVLTGALRGSGHVTVREGHGAAVAVELGFGGPAAPYAVYVHEHVQAHHANGQAKFLESAVNEAVSRLPERIAARVRL